MTKEDILKQLKDAGLDPGSWTEGGGKAVKHPFVEKQKSGLAAIRELVVMQLQKDQEEVRRLTELKKKLEHGGCSSNG